MLRYLKNTCGRGDVKKTWNTVYLVKKTKQSQAIKEHHHFLKSLSCHITSVPD